MKKDRRFRQGIFKPIYSEKFIGVSDPIYRSSYELKFFRWADTNSNILAWGSENIIIPYTSPLDGRVHRYFVDNFVIFKDKNNVKQKFLIEIKPASQVAKPTNVKNKQRRTILYEQKTWIINQAKWKAAEEWSNRKGYKFLILTEKELGIR
tara:strand:- start:2528 stop:2980 length:453 start_codon:yes stop_codon:yes gene_type:complete